MPVNPLPAAPAKRNGIGVVEKNKQREERLAAALRENLRRRKSQARELAGPQAKDDANGVE